MPYMGDTADQLAFYGTGKPIGPICWESWNPAQRGVPGSVCPWRSAGRLCSAPVTAVGPTALQDRFEHAAKFHIKFGMVGWEHCHPATTISNCYSTSIPLPVPIPPALTKIPSISGLSAHSWPGRSFPQQLSYGLSNAGRSAPQSTCQSGKAQKGEWTQKPIRLRIAANEPCYKRNVICWKGKKLLSSRFRNAGCHQGLGDTDHDAWPYATDLKCSLTDEKLLRTFRRACCSESPQLSSNHKRKHLEFPKLNLRPQPQVAMLTSPRPSSPPHRLLILGLRSAGQTA